MSARSMLCSALALVVALTSCATQPRLAPVPDASPLPREFGRLPLLLRTDPTGAECSITQGGIEVAKVPATPGYANVPRASDSIEVVCRQGPLEQRITIAAVPIGDVPREPSLPPADESEAAGFARELAKAGFVLTLVFPPLVIPLAIPILATAYGLNAATEGGPEYGYLRPPPLLLAPADFESDLARDEYFIALKTRLDADAEAAHTRVDATCTPNLFCLNCCRDEHARVDAEITAKRVQIAGLRARARVAGQ